MGWKFTASSGSLVPKKFWGLSRRSIRPQLKLDITEEDASNSAATNQEEVEEGDDQLRLVY